VTPHPGQERWLQESRRPENLLVTGNRWGKSFAEAIKIIHHALFRIRDRKYDRCGHYRIVTASITLDQANIIFNLVLRFLKRAFGDNGITRKVTVTPYPRIILGNDAIIEARSTQRRGTYLLGNDYDFFVFDEVAFENDAEFVVNEVVKMRLADRCGRLDLVSTPNGRNWFYRKMCELRERPDDAYIQGGDSRENIHISREYLRMQIRYLGERSIAQNIQGQFVDSGGEIIPGKYIDNALIDQPPMPDNLHPVKKTGFYVTAWDLARKKSATVGITIHVSDGKCTVAALTRIKKWDWNVILSEIRNRQRIYPGRLVIDATGLGDVVVSQLADLNPAAFIFTPKSKAELLTNLELFHSLGNVKYARWEIPDDGGRIWSLEDELRSARWDDNGDCDGLMALALALWPLRKPDSPVIGPKLGKI
jgi:hypothetical protein